MEMTELVILVMPILIFQGTGCLKEVATEVIENFINKRDL